MNIINPEVISTIVQVSGMFVIAIVIYILVKNERKWLGVSSDRIPEWIINDNRISLIIE